MIVEILVEQNFVVLRVRNSELIILPEHANKLRQLDDIKAFSQYFLANALLNRPARKLFQAWMRKDLNLWQRLFTTIQSKVILPEDNKDTSEKSADDNNMTKVAK